MPKSILALLLAFLFAPAFAGQPHKPDLHIDTDVRTVIPDYRSLINWAAHPQKHDQADSIPSFLKDEKRDTGVDVFFLHPTTYTGHFHGWNAEMDDAKVNEKTDKGTILFQASVFNASCRVFAPRYRQAHLKAFFTKDTVAAAKALDLAYQDLATAFRYYLDHWNHGRPIIIASHSQGTRHAVRLLKEFFDGKPLQKQLVCAYLVGFQIPKNAFKTIPAGDTPDATGCVVGWRSFKKGYVPAFVKKENGNCICVNPITWKMDNEWSAKESSPGVLGTDFNKLLKPKELRAQIALGYNILWVEMPIRKYRAVRNYHVGDYNLYYLNIRQNVKQRVEAWHAAHKQ